MSNVPNHDASGNSGEESLAGKDQSEASHTETSLSDEIRGLLRGLRREVTALREELSSLRGAVDDTLPAKEASAADGTAAGALLTREEAAERLRISMRTLDDLEASGRLRAVRIGRRVLYNPAALDAFIRQQSREGGRR